MQLRKKFRDLIFERPANERAGAEALKIQRPAPAAMETRSWNVLSRSPPYQPVQAPPAGSPPEQGGPVAVQPEKISAGPGSPEDPADTSFYILPDDERLRSRSGEGDGTPDDDPEMRWLDEARIRDILKNLRLDEPISADGGAAHNIIGYANGGYPGSGEWAGLARAADAATFPVFAIDSSRRIIAWNQAMAELTGIGAPEMMGRGDYAYAVPFYGSPRPMLIDHVVIPPEIAKILDPGAVTRTGETYTSGLEEAEIKGKKVLIQSRATRIYDGRGKVTAAIQSIGISPAKPPVRPVKTAAPAGMVTGVTFAGSPAAVPAPAPARAGKAPASPLRKNDEDLLRQRRGELTTAFAHLTDTEEKLLRNYEDLTRTQAQLIESERKVRAQELFLKCVISDAREGIVAFDRNLRYILWNRFMENLTGIPAQKVLGKRASELFPVLRVAGADLLLERALGGETVESPDFSFMTPMTSKQVWVRVIYSPLTDAGSAISGVIGVIQDTTARKVMEYALQTTIVQLMESESKYRNVFNAKNDPLLLVSPATRVIVDLNEAACRLYGWTRDEMLGMSLLDLIAGPDTREDSDLSKLPVSLTQNHRRKNGSVFPADISADSFELKGSQVMIVSVRDLTGLQKIAESLRIANAKLNLMIGITRHDVLNNLTAVMGYNELLREDNVDPHVKEMLAKQEKAIATIRNQIEFTREYDDLGIRPPQWQNVCATAMRAYHQFVNTITFTCTTGDLEVYADPLLERVFYNLFDNSFRYGEGITSINITFEQRPEGLVLFFEDDGRGIPTEDKDRIFARGFGRHTGLGLFLAREILTITRISIKETGRYRKGARFEFVVPEGAYRFTNAPAPAWQEQENGTNLSVFLAQIQGGSRRSIGTD